MSEELKLCQQKIGYQFSNDGLLLRALRHRSLGKDSNERLEFLGDAVLDFVIAADLYLRYPDMKEGELSRLRSNLVNAEILFMLAQELELSNFIQVSAAELKTGILQESILADGVEAIIGAIYLDGGFEAAKQRILVWYAARLQQVTCIVKKDSKTALQELLQLQHRPLPTYLVVKTEGEAHAQTFYVECAVSGSDVKTTGFGPSKRKAEQDAAAKFLQWLESAAED